MDYYGSAEGYRLYEKARGRNVPEALEDADIESALLVASEWLDDLYREEFIGYKKDSKTQVREWPREDAQVCYFPYFAYEDDEIPVEVIDSTYEACRRDLEKPGCLAQDYQPQLYGSVAVEGAVSVTYKNEAGAEYVQLQIPAVERRIKRVLTNSGNSIVSGKVCR